MAAGGRRSAALGVLRRGVLAVLLGATMVGLVVDGAAAVLRVDVVADAFVLFIPVFASTVATRSGRSRDLGRGPNARVFDSALRSGVIPEGANTAGWLWHLRGSSRPTPGWLPFVVMAITIAAGAAGAARLPQILPFAIATVLAAGAGLALVLPGETERMRRREHLTRLLLDRIDEQDAAAASRTG